MRLESVLALSETWQAIIKQGWLGPRNMLQKVLCTIPLYASIVRSGTVWNQDFHVGVLLWRDNLGLTLAPG